MSDAKPLVIVHGANKTIGYLFEVWKQSDQNFYGRVVKVAPEGNAQTAFVNYNQAAETGNAYISKKEVIKVNATEEDYDTYVQAMTQANERFQAAFAGIKEQLRRELDAIGIVLPE